MVRVERRLDVVHMSTPVRIVCATVACGFILGAAATFYVIDAVIREARRLAP